MATSSVDVHQLEKLRPLGSSHVTVSCTTVINKPLGKLEEFSSARHHLGIFLNVGISVSYTYKGALGVDLRETIFSALSDVIQRHPVLSTIPVDEDSAAPYFARLPEINLEDAVTFLIRQDSSDGHSQDAELDSLLERQHNIDFKANYGSVPFWRLLILTNPNSDIEFVASFIYHHALGDGASGIAFHKHFFVSLTSAAVRQGSKIIYSLTKPLLPNLELLHPLPIPPASPYLQESALWTGTPVRLPMRTLFRTLTLSHQLTTSLIQTCRTHQTTLTSTLPVLIARVLRRLLPGGPHALKCIIPVNIRRFLPRDSIADDDMGVWIDAISISYDSAKIPTWDEAQRSKDIISAYLASDGQRINVARMKQRGDMREFFLSLVGKERDSSFEVSNLGVVKNMKEEVKNEGWSMGRCRFSRSAFAAGSAFSIGTITGCDGCLCLGFSWQESVIERNIMEEIVEGVKTEVEQVTRER